MGLHDETRDELAAFGEQLRRTREGAGLQLEDIVAETKVSKAIFRALEEGRFERLPERVFCRSFVAQYAKTVGVDDGPLLASFDRAWETYLSASGSTPNLVAMTDDLGRSIPWRFWIPIAAGILILLIAAVVILRGSTSMGEGLVPDPRRSGVRQANAVLATHPPSEPTPRRTAVETTAPAEETVMVELTVIVQPGEECWIHYRDGNGQTGQQLLAGGQRLTLALAGPVKLTVGNAGAVEIMIGDRVLSDLGLPGQVIHTEVTRDGFTRLGPVRAERS